MLLFQAYIISLNLLALSVAAVPPQLRAFAFRERQARMWEISENLHRAELTTLQRAEQTAEWIRLAGEKSDANLSAQVAPKGKYKSGEKAHRPESGINLAARELGIERKVAQRAVQIDTLVPAAKEAARWGLQPRERLDPTGTTL